MQELLFAYTQAADLWHFEQRTGALGYLRIAGVDEAGRGPLAGPVVAAAVILPPDCSVVGLNDSKKLTERQRERLFDEITGAALAVGVGSAPPALIDRINILQATRQAMLQAVTALLPAPDYLLIDGITTIPSPLPQQTIKQGDSRSASIAAASIIAKVTRDRLMLAYDQQWPQYGFARHKGYGCAAHLAAIRSHGPCPIHRTSFRGVREFCGLADAAASWHDPVTLQ
ncbi:ribonuclease HII [Trichlorobacter ammonificans]|uniref:Ribonuclease HII n=1 Tax=Trichlorobacter ammonificans TaxID=2916410 RepID=A0ABN8HKX2_9BACT|nr:ribonuclease HII [Trichlorobacter ammonificans]CAH2031582.1 RNase HII [Trichlorobacter ammonificans]